MAAPSAISDSLWFFSLSLCIKTLLIPSYHSTDFDVHRHWLALTSSLPLHRWYLDSSSPWTLDYPPFFALFSFLLSLPAPLFDPAITAPLIDHAAPPVVAFLRLSVAASDLLLLAGVHRFCARLPLFRRRIALALVIWSPALLIVDHIHFQYNGFLLGVLMVSLGFVAEGRDLAGGMVFAVLVCLKHLFVVAAPLYFVYLARHYCGGEWRRFLAMGVAVGAVFLGAFGPFVYYGQVMRVWFSWFLGF